MTTETEIIYTIIDIVRAAEISQDEPITERLVRNFIKTHRGKLLSKAYKQGAYISDEAFQEYGDVTFTENNDGEWVSGDIPKIIRFKNNEGYILTKSGYTISNVHSEEYETSKCNKFNKYHPKTKHIGNKMFLYLGLYNDCCPDSMLNKAINDLKFEASSGEIKIPMKAVFSNPDSGLGYDFTKSPYPLDDELIESITNSVLARDFNLFLRMKSDETTDGRNNNSEFGTREEVQ